MYLNSHTAYRQNPCMGSDRSTTIPDAAGLCGGYMEVQLLEAPKLWEPLSGDELDKARAAFLGEAQPESTALEANDLDDAPF